jgi:hypothetical protein
VARNTRGILDANAAVAYRMAPSFLPQVGLQYAKEFIRHGGDSHRVVATLGAVVPLGEGTRAKLGWAEPIAGRNTSRSRGLVSSFVWSF